MLPTVFLSYVNAYDANVSPEVEEDSTLKKRVSSVIATMNTIIARNNVLPPVRARLVHKNTLYVLIFAKE